MTPCSLSSGHVKSSCITKRKGKRSIVARNRPFCSLGQATAMMDGPCAYQCARSAWKKGRTTHQRGSSLSSSFGAIRQNFALLLHYCREAVSSHVPSRTANSFKALGHASARLREAPSATGPQTMSPVLSGSPIAMRRLPRWKPPQGESTRRGALGAVPCHPHSQTALHRDGSTRLAALFRDVLAR
jgi:hypothetical protein